MEIYTCIHLQTVTLRGAGGRGYSKKLIAAEKCIVESEKLIEGLEKKY